MVRHSFVKLFDPLLLDGLDKLFDKQWWSVLVGTELVYMQLSYRKQIIC